MVLCVVLVQQGGVVPRHAGTRPDLRQTRQSRSQLLPPLPGPGACGARVAGGQWGRSYEGEVPRTTWGSRESRSSRSRRVRRERRVKTRPPRPVRGLRSHTPSGPRRTASARAPAARAGAAAMRRTVPRARSRRRSGDARGRCGPRSPGPVGQARQARGGAGGEVAARGTGGEWGAGVCAGGVRGGGGCVRGVRGGGGGVWARGNGSGACGSGVFGSGAYGFVAYGGGVCGSSGAGARRCCGRCCCCSRCLWVFFLCWFFCRTRRCLAFRIAPARGSESDGVPVPADR